MLAEAGPRALVLFPVWQLGLKTHIMAILPEFWFCFAERASWLFLPAVPRKSPPCCPTQLFSAEKLPLCEAPGALPAGELPPVGEGEDVSKDEA